MKKYLKSLIGKKVIVRSYSEGVNFGTVKHASKDGIVLNNCTRLWYSKPKDNLMSWNEGVAESGVSEDSKLSTVVNEKAIIEKYSILILSNNAIENIENHKKHSQNG